MIITINTRNMSFPCDALGPASLHPTYRRDLQALHATTWTYFAFATAAGLLFHSLLMLTGNIFVPIVAHALFNSVSDVGNHLRVWMGGLSFFSQRAGVLCCLARGALYSYCSIRLFFVRVDQFSAAL